MQFADADTELETYWRAIVLYGRNVASYKFALAKSLLELSQAGKDSVTLEELSAPFSRHLCEHLRHKPATGRARAHATLYYSGIGDRNSQGFGMFDIVEKPL